MLLGSDNKAPPHRAQEGPEVRLGIPICGGRACHGEGLYHKVGGCRSGPQSLALPERPEDWHIRTEQHKMNQDVGPRLQLTYLPITHSHTLLIIRLPLHVSMFRSFTPLDFYSIH